MGRHKGAAVLGDMGFSSKVPFAQPGSIPAPRNQLRGGQGTAVQHRSHRGLHCLCSAEGAGTSHPHWGCGMGEDSIAFLFLCSVFSKILLQAEKMPGLWGLCLETCGAGISTGLCEVRGKCRASFPKPLGVQSVRKTSSSNEIKPHQVQQ